jgi:hypothetical protein
VDEVPGALRQVWENLVSVPWKDFVSSPALWAVTFAHMVERKEGREGGREGGRE